MTARDVWRWTDERGVQRLVGTDELRAALASSILPPTTLVWREGMKEWAPASTMPDLASAAFAAGAGKADNREPIADHDSFDARSTLKAEERRATLVGIPSPTDGEELPPISRRIAVPATGERSDRPGITQVPPFGAPAPEGEAAVPPAPRVPAPVSDGETTAVKPPPKAEPKPAPAPAKEQPKRKVTTQDIDNLWATTTRSDEDETIPRRARPSELAAAAAAAAEATTTGQRDARTRPKVESGAKKTLVSAADPPAKPEAEARPALPPPPVKPRAPHPPPRAATDAKRPEIRQDPPSKIGPSVTLGAPAEAPPATLPRPLPKPPLRQNTVRMTAEAPAVKPPSPPPRPIGQSAPLSTPTKPMVPVVPAVRIKPPSKPPQPMTEAARQELSSIEELAASVSSVPFKMGTSAGPTPMVTTLTGVPRAQVPGGVADTQKGLPVVAEPLPRAEQTKLTRTLVSGRDSAANLLERPAESAPAQSNGATSVVPIDLPPLVPSEEPSEEPHPLDTTTELVAGPHPPPSFAQHAAQPDQPPVTQDSPTAAPVPSEQAFGPLPPPRAPMPSRPPPRPPQPSQDDLKLPSEPTPTPPPAAAFTPPPPSVTPHSKPAPSREPLPHRRKRGLDEQVSVPVSSLVAAGGMLIGMVVAAFFVGRASSVSVPRLTARPSLQVIPALARAAIPPPPKPCWMVKQPAAWAAHASKSIPFDAVATKGGTLALGYARDANRALGLEINLGTGTVEGRFDDRADGDIERVTPSPSLEFKVTRAGSGPLRSSVEAGSFTIGLGEGGIAIASASGAPRALWPLSGEEGLGAASTHLAGDHGFLLTFRRGGAIWGGFVGAGGNASGDLVQVAGSGGAVGKPAGAWNGREVAVIFADRPDAEGRYEIRVGHAPPGKVPATTAVLPLPKGGPGGDAFAPDIAGLPDGRWILMWTEGASGSRAVRAQTLAPDFTPLGDPIALSPPAGNYGQGLIGVAGSYAATVFLSKGAKNYELWGAVLQCG